MCTRSCEIDATACSASLTEESSGMEMDHMVTDALALKKGIRWVWLRTDLPPLGWGGLNCTICLLFVDCVPQCLFTVCLSISGSVCYSFSCLFLSTLPVVCTLFLFLWLCLAWSWFIAGFLDIFHYGLFLITFIPKTGPIVHVNCITKLKRMPWLMI